jgi:hypothetical protein
LQISIDESKAGKIGFDDENKIIIIFLLNFLGCLICCGLIQGIIVMSKKLNNYRIRLKKNYRQYKGLLRYREFHQTYIRERDEMENKEPEIPD